MKRINLYGNNKSMVCKVDDEDFLRFSNQKFYARKDGKYFYAMNRKGQLLHRLIMVPSKNDVIDHLNHDGLDNRKTNLRECSRAVNTQNRQGANINGCSGTQNVHWQEKWQKWRVKFVRDGKEHYFGGYSSLEDAKKKADEVRSLFGK